MPKSVKTKPEKAIKPEDLDLDPDAWPKFEKLIKSAAKLGPKPHVAKKAKTPRDKLG